MNFGLISLTRSEVALRIVLFAYSQCVCDWIAIAIDGKEAARCPRRVALVRKGKRQKSWCDGDGTWRSRPGRTWTVSTRLRLWSWSKGQWSVQHAVAPSRVEMFRAPESHNFLGRQGSKPVEKWNCHELPAGISRPLRRQDRPILCNMHVARRNWFCIYTDIHVKDCESASMLVAPEMEFVRTCGSVLSFQETMWCFLMSISTAGARLSPISDKSVVMVWYGLMVVWVFQILAGYIIYPVMVAAWIRFDML